MKPDIFYLNELVYRPLAPRLVFPIAFARTKRTFLVSGAQNNPLKRLFLTGVGEGEGGRKDNNVTI